MLVGDGVKLRAEERRPDYYEAVDFVLEKLEQQAKKHHKRQIERNRHHSAKEVPAAFAAAVGPNVADYAEPIGANVPAGTQAAPEENGNGMPRITRNKRFAMKPMTAVDAAVEMEMMGHAFYVFRNTLGDVNVVYRRNDGTVGLIEVGE
jgi:putative sigma-54 modulation protein